MSYQKKDSSFGMTTTQDIRDLFARPSIVTIYFQCFNMDVCSLDKTKPWEEYRNKTQHMISLLKKKQEQAEPFICHYRLPENRTSVVILDKNTTLIDLLIWFLLPLAGIILSWLGIIFVALWFCCPPHRKQKPEDYQKITAE